jgi:hypothetical protein
MPSARYSCKCSLIGYLAFVYLYCLCDWTNSIEFQLTCTGFLAVNFSSVPSFVHFTTLASIPSDGSVLLLFLLHYPCMYWSSNVITRSSDIESFHYSLHTSASRHQNILLVEKSYFMYTFAVQVQI